MQSVLKVFCYSLCLYVAIAECTGPAGTCANSDEAALVQKDFQILKPDAEVDDENTDADAEVDDENVDEVAALIQFSSEADEELDKPNDDPNDPMAALVDGDGFVCFDAPESYIRDCLLGKKPKRGTPEAAEYRGAKSPWVRSTFRGTKIVPGGNCFDLGFHMDLGSHRRFYKHNVTLFAKGEQEKFQTMKQFTEQECMKDMTCMLFFQGDGRVWRKKNPLCGLDRPKIVMAEEEEVPVEVEEVVAVPKEAQNDKSSKEVQDDKSGAVTLGSAWLMVLATAGAFRTI